MRIIVVAAVAATLAACGQSSEEKAQANAAVNFVPPFVLSRLDYGGVIERRFRRLDRNEDDKLIAAELPGRMAGRLAEFDTDKDGAISTDEWSRGQLARFDRQDANRDGTVTSDEREAARRQRQDDLPTPAEEPIANTTPAG